MKTKTVMKHYYLCDFHILKPGEPKSKGRIVSRYVEAGNAQKAYDKAQLICASSLLAASPDRVICTHKDVHQVLIGDARKALKEKPGLLILIDENDSSAPIEHIYMENKIFEYADGSFLSTKIEDGEPVCEICTSLEAAKRFINKSVPEI